MNKSRSSPIPICLALAGLLTLAACVPPPPPESACAGLPGDSGITAQLFFGRKQRGGRVSATDWRDFMATAVTPRFPLGLTVLEGTGQWQQRGTGRVNSEPSTVVVIATDRTPDTIARLEAIRSDYRERFQQESVGLVITPSCASF